MLLIVFSLPRRSPALSVNDHQPIEVGIKFSSSVAGSITAIEFYRATGDTGSDIVDLWSSTGTLLATGTFNNTNATGWQTVTFSSPVAITAGTTYVASYHSNSAYSDTRNYFTSAYKRRADRAGECRRLCLWRSQHYRHLPDQHLPGQQLLRGCRLQPRPAWPAPTAGGKCRFPDDHGRRPVNH